MTQQERRAPQLRHTHARTRIALLALLVAGCGSSPAPQSLSEPPSATGTPTPTSRPVPAPVPSPATTIEATAGSGHASPYPPMSPRPSAAPSTLRPTAGTAVVRDGDSGSTLHLRVGQQVRIRLEQGTWDPPQSSSAAVVRRTSSGGYPTDQPVDAVFAAVSPGTADLTATSDAACFHTQPRCLMATREWQVHVVVG